MNPGKKIVDDFSPLDEKQEKKNKMRKESLEDILSAVKEKSNVVKPLPTEKPKNSRPSGLVVEEDGSIKNFSPLKENLKKEIVPDELSCNNKVLKMADYFVHPIKYMFLRFCGGLFFSLGAISAIALFVILIYVLRDFSFTKILLKKIIFLSQTMFKA